MDEPLRLIQYLYGETSAEETAAIEQRLADDAALRDEYEALKSTKDTIDRRPSASSASSASDASQAGPDPLVVDQIVAAAGEAARARSDAPADDRFTRTAADDRDARSGTTGLSRRLQVASATLAILLMVGVGWWQWTGPGASPLGASSAESASGLSLDRAVRSAEPARRLDGRRLNGSGLQTTADVPEWDEGDDVVRLHRRIELVQSRSTPAQWSGLQPASTVP